MVQKHGIAQSLLYLTSSLVNVHKSNTYFNIFAIMMVENLLILCTLTTTDVKYSKNCATPCFWTIADVKCIKRCTSLCALTTVHAK